MYKLNFNYKGEKIEFEDLVVKKLAGKVVDWLFSNGYKFDNNLHRAFTKKPISLEDLKKSQVSEIYLKRLRHFHKMPDGNLLFIGGNVEPIKNYLKQMLVKFGIEKDTIFTEGFGTDSVIKKFGHLDTDLDTDLDDFSEIEEHPIKKTFMEAAQLILKQNDNQPMSAREIWDEIEQQDLVETKSLNPVSTLNSNMLAYSENSGLTKKYKNKLFHIVANNPAMFILINPEQEVQSVEEDEIDLDLPTITPSFVLPEDDILPFTHFRGVQSQEEKEKNSEVEPVKNPFRQAVCVLGKSGKGKSTTIEKILDNFGEEMEYEFIIPTSSTTNLLSQYSPKANDYNQSRLGKLIMKANNNPSKMYTAVFDECHKSNVIEMINDELLQCISLYRNMGKRFISLDDDTASLYKGLKGRGGNLLLPDNFGFIFLSSKPDVIISNSDFFNRVNIYVLTKQPRGVENISFDNTEYFTQIGDLETGSKTLEDIDRIRELNDAD